MANRDYFKRIRTTKGISGLLVEKEQVYRKAYFHDRIYRWNPKTYGEEGQNIQASFINDDIKFFKFNISGRGKYLLKTKDLLSFVKENPKCNVSMFNSERILFPISICRELKL